MSIWGGLPDTHSDNLQTLLFPEWSQEPPKDHTLAVPSERNRRVDF